MRLCWAVCAAAVYLVVAAAGVNVTASGCGSSGCGCVDRGGRACGVERVASGCVKL